MPQPTIVLGRIVLIAAIFKKYNRQNLRVGDLLKCILKTQYGLKDDCIELLFSDQSQVVLGPVSPMSSKKSIDLGSIFRKAASVASVAAKHAIAAATASYDEDEMFPLKCCLMSISLPWDTIAHDLLFKVTNDFSLATPVVNNRH